MGLRTIAITELNLHLLDSFVLHEASKRCHHSWGDRIVGIWCISVSLLHDDLVTLKHILHHLPFMNVNMRLIHRPPVGYALKGQSCFSMELSVILDAVTPICRCSNYSSPLTQWHRVYVICRLIITPISCSMRSMLLKYLLQQTIAVTKFKLAPE